MQHWTSCSQTSTALFSPLRLVFVVVTVARRCGDRGESDGLDNGSLWC
jgi:hypothetical protein